MQINNLGHEKFPLVEVVSERLLLRNTQDALDILGETGFSNIVLYEHNFDPDFFDLSTKKLGEILQKFTNYKIKVAIVGEFEKYPSTVLQQFIYESNKVGDYLFMPSIQEVKKRWLSV